MIRRIPILPTLLVLAAVAVMVRLGFWQIDRLGQKEALLARYAAASKTVAEAPWPADAKAIDPVLFRRSHVVCRDVADDEPTSGQNTAGVSGWAHVFPCTTFEGAKARVVMGWSIDPAPRRWHGGRVSGVIAPTGRIFADPHLAQFAGLQPVAPPDPANIPNNHLAYAVQWFFFALIASVIYALALRKRLAAPGGEG